MIEKSSAPKVATRVGVVEGIVVRTEHGPINAFLGIPYAEPPIGALRFKKTVPVSPWNGVRKCKKYKSRAPQKDLFLERLELGVGKSEDCLYLNVIAPGWNSPSEKGFPVMFYVHGGGFVVDSAVRYNYRKIAKLLASHGVVVVTIQYRLGFLGFFTTGDDACLGNFGIWDQVTALHWVANNIEHFGGDRNRITVVGQSAGAVSADLLTLSPYSRYLIHQVILLGGNAECTWALSSVERVSEYCRKRSEKLGWQGNDSEKLLEFLRDKPAHDLADGMIGNRIMFKTGRLPLTPVIDGDLFPKCVAELRAEAPVINSMAGLTEDEGLLFVAMGRMACNQSDIEMAVGLIANAVEGSDIDAREVVQKVYMKEVDASDGTRAHAATLRRAFIDMLSDLTSNYGTGMYMEKQVNNGGVVYAFSLEHCNPMCYGLLNLYLPYNTATHGIELIYLFDASVFVTPFLRTQRDRDVTTALTSFVTNFIKYGNPNGIVASEGCDSSDGDWKPATIDANERHLRIANDIQMCDIFKNGRITELKRTFNNVSLNF